MLVLHLGPHKTASTYLQANFRRQRAGLLKSGWIYPSAGVRTGVAHHHVAEAPHEFIAGKGPAFDDMRAVARRARSGGRSVLLSAEGLRRWNARQVDALADVFEGQPLRLVYVLRDPVSVLRSMWAQSVKVGRSEELPRFLARHMQDPKRSRILNPLRDLKPHLNRQRGEIVVLLYDELVRQGVDIYTAFAREGLGIEGATPVDVPSNPRPELELTEFLRLISESGAYVSLEQRMDVGDAVTFLFSPEERRRIVATIRERGANALRTIEVPRATAYYDEIEQRLYEELGPCFRPQRNGDRLFPTTPETWTYYNGAALMADPVVGELVERASARLRKSRLRVAVMQSGFRTLLAGRRLRNIVSARLP